MSENNNNNNKIETDKSSYAKFQNFFDKNRSTILVWTFGLPVLFFFFLPGLNGTLTGYSYFFFSFQLVFIFAAMALSLNLEVGYLGIPNFGKVAFIAVGGYTYAIVLDALSGDYVEGETWWFGLAFTHAYLIIFGLFMSIVITGIFGVLLTLPTLKLREDYLAIVTIVAGEIIRIVAFNEDAFGSFEGFSVDNPVNLQFDTDDFITGFFISSGGLLAILLVYSVIVALYFYASTQNTEKDKTLQNINLQRAITYATLLSIIVIFMDYFGVFGDPSLGLHLGLMAFTIGLIFYKSYFQNRISEYIFFTIMFSLAIVNYFIGAVIASPSDETKIKITDWFTMLLTLFTLLIVYVIMEEIYNSPFGRTLRAIREDDTSAISVGKSIFDYRLRALVIASALAGFAGAIYAMLITIVTPMQYLPLLTFQLYIMLIIGGTGNNKGTIFGAFFVQLLYQITRGTLFQDSHWTYPFTDKAVGPVNIGLIFVGVMLIVFLIYSPEGVIPEVKKNNEKYYAMAKYYETKSSEGDKLLDILKSVTGYEEETEDWIT